MTLSQSHPVVSTHAQLAFFRTFLQTEDSELKKQLLMDARDLKEQSMDAFSLKQWTWDSLADAKEQLGKALLRNEDLVRKLDEVLARCIRFMLHGMQSLLSQSLSAVAVGLFCSCFACRYSLSTCSRRTSKGTPWF